MARQVSEESISVTRNPLTGIVMGERLGSAFTEAELMESAGYGYETHRVVPGSAVVKAWPNTLKTEAGPVQVWNHYLAIKVEPLADEIISRDLTEALLKEIRKEKTGRHDRKPVRRKTNRAGVLAEVDLFDPHFQMLAWGPETGSNWDIKLCSAEYRNAFLELREGVLSSGHGVDRWLMCVGQDLFHTDKTIDGKGATTARGTVQDVDTRHQKAAMIVRKLLTQMVLDMLETAPVDLVVVPGNHDTERTWWMGEILDARFEGNPHVNVDNRPIGRKYYRYGNALIGFTHGHNEKPADLQRLMSNEARKDWGETVFREWHMGHWHHEYTKDINGVVARFLPSLAGTDSWHYDKGFVHAQKGARAFLWTQDKGICNTIHYNRPVTAQELAYTAPLLRGDR